MPSDSDGPQIPTLDECEAPSSRDVTISNREVRMKSPPKRRRVPLACTTCRIRKSRCDGRRPKCSACTELCLACEYQAPTKEQKLRRSGQSRAELAHKVKELEGRVQATENSVPAVDPTSSSGARNTEARLSCQELGLDSTRRAPVALAPAEPEVESAVDVLATATFTQESESNIGHFGPSSNHALFRSLSDAFAQIIAQGIHDRRPISARKPQRPSALLPANVPRLGSRSNYSAAKSSVDVSYLPAEEDALTLFDHFSNSVGTLLPFLKHVALASEYRRLRSESRPRCLSGAKRALVNIVFAHAASILPERDHEKFYRRAIACLDHSTLRGTSIELIQALLLVSTYQQNNQLSITSWTYHSLAVKAAFQLGLHSPLRYREHSLYEAELRKRLWYAVINQDRHLGMTLGRPFLIPTRHVRTSKPEDPASLSRVVPMLTPKVTEGLFYYNDLIDLYAIVADIIHHLYDDNIEAEEPQRVHELIAKRTSSLWALQEWRIKVSGSCQILSAPDMETLSSLPVDSVSLRLVMSIYYYRSAILLDAAILTRIVSEIVNPRRGKSGFEAEVDFLMDHAVSIVQHDFTAVSSLIQAIRMLTSCGDDLINRNNAWFLCSYTTLTANLHLLGILLLSRVRNDVLTSAGIPRSDVRKYLDEGIHIMKCIQRSSLMSRTARHCLTSFLEIFDSLDQDIPPAGVVGQRISEEILSSTHLDASCEVDFSQWVTETANNFLWQYGQNNVLGDDLDFFANQGL